MNSLKVHISGQDRPVVIVFNNDIVATALKMRKAALNARNKSGKNNNTVNTRNNQVENMISIVSV